MRRPRNARVLDRAVLGPLVFLGGGHRRGHSRRVRRLRGWERRREVRLARDGVWRAEE